MSKAKKISDIPHKIAEKLDPTPLKARVHFKRPLTAHEKIQRALRTQKLLDRMDSQPGDESFDTPIEAFETPHQLVPGDDGELTDMTAGEHVMLQHERELAHAEVLEAVERKRNEKLAKAARRAKKHILAKKTDESVGEESDEDSD